MIVATKFDIARIEFDGGNGKARKHVAANTWMVIGVDDAQAAVRRVMSPIGENFTRFNIAQRRTLLENAVRAGIRDGGQHPHAPSEKACLLPVNRREKR